MEHKFNKQVVQKLVDTDWQRLSDDELLAAIRRMEAGARQVHLVSLAITRVIDERGLARERGATSTSALLRQLVKLSPREATRRVKTAQDVTASAMPTRAVVAPKLAEAAAAVRAREISDEVDRFV